MLGVLDQRQLAHSLFPLGDSTKTDVRAEAAERGLLVADKPDSHDICFVADGDNAGWLREKLGDRAPNHGGDIVDDDSGEVLGRHDGTYGFTIGQRKGLRIGRPAPDGKPRFVLDIEPVAGTVTVGPRERLAVHSLRGIRPRWCGAVPDVLEGPAVTRAAAGPRRGAAGRRCGSSRLRPRRGRAARAGVRHRPRAGRRRLRRHPRRRLGHDLRDRPRAGVATCVGTGIGSMPGEDLATSLQVVLDELGPRPRSAVPARAARSRRRLGDDRPHPGAGRRRSASTSSPPAGG